MADQESFELLDEKIQFTFEGHGHFLYHKYNHDCRQVTTSFLQALESKLSCKNESLYLHQGLNEPINTEIIRSVAMSYGSNVISVCFGSMALTDKMVEGILPHLSSLQYLQFDGINIGSVVARAMAMFLHKTLKSLRLSGCHLITSESCG